MKDEGMLVPSSVSWTGPKSVPCSPSSRSLSQISWIHQIQRSAYNGMFGKLDSGLSEGLRRWARASISVLKQRKAK